MRMATDYKRCSVFLSDVRVVAVARGLSGLKSFFLEPVQEFRERDRMLRPHRYGWAHNLFEPPPNSVYSILVSMFCLCHG